MSASPFKDLISQDLESVFHNTEEFAEDMDIKYDKVWMKVPAILDYSGAKDREKVTSNRSNSTPYDGIILCDATLYVTAAHFKGTPKKDRNLQVGKKIFTINRVEEECGEYILYLEMFDE